MEKTDELINWLKLCNITGLGPSKLSKLLNLFGSVQAVVRTPDNDLLRTKIFNEEMLQQWNRSKNAPNQFFESIFRICDEQHIVILPMYAKEYPLYLKTLPNPPLTLFLQGDLSLLNKKIVAIVGSRDSDERSCRWAYETAKQLAEVDIVVVSGGAKGIDIQAHQGALDAGGKTICVFGTGILRPYPEEHQTIFDTIRQNGLIVSEHLPTFPGSRIALLQRNRITSGLSKAVLQVTGNDIGGSATQMKIAADQRIPIFCPPSRLNLQPSTGILNKKKEFHIVELENIEQILMLVNKVSPPKIQTDLHSLVNE